MMPLDVSFQKTALVLIDLQKGIVASSNGQDVVEKAARLVRLFREKGGFIAFVNVDFHDGADRLKPATDQPVPTVQPPEGWAEFVPELGVRPAVGRFFRYGPGSSASPERDRYDCLVRNRHQYRGGKHGEGSISARLPPNLHHGCNEDLQQGGA